VNTINKNYKNHVKRELPPWNDSITSLEKKIIKRSEIRDVKLPQKTVSGSFLPINNGNRPMPAWNDSTSIEPLPKIYRRERAEPREYGGAKSGREYNYRDAGYSNEDSDDYRYSSRSGGNPGNIDFTPPSKHYSTAVDNSRY
jgi:hypothetical protein